MMIRGPPRLIRKIISQILYSWFFLSDYDSNIQVIFQSVQIEFMFHLFHPFSIRKPKHGRFYVITFARIHHIKVKRFFLVNLSNIFYWTLSFFLFLRSKRENENKSYFNFSHLCMDKTFSLQFSIRKKISKKRWKELYCETFCLHALLHWNSDDESK